MSFFGNLKNTSDYLFGVGNNYYYRLEEYFCRAFESPALQGYDMREIRSRKKLRTIIRTLTTAITAFALSKLAAGEIDVSLAFALPMEAMRFGSYSAELAERKNFLEQRKSMLSALRYQPLEEICDEANLNIEQRKFGYDLNGDNDK